MRSSLTSIALLLASCTTPDVAPATDIAAPAIAQQLRLRNIAGAIVVDFVNMRSSYDRDKVQAALAEAGK